MQPDAPGRRLETDAPQCRRPAHAGEPRDPRSGVHRLIGCGRTRRWPPATRGIEAERGRRATAASACELWSSRHRAARLGGGHHVDRRLPLRRVAPVRHRGASASAPSAQRRRAGAAEPGHRRHRRRRGRRRRPARPASASSTWSYLLAAAACLAIVLVPSRDGLPGRQHPRRRRLRRDADRAPTRYVKVVAPPERLGKAMGLWGIYSIVFATAASLAGGMLAESDWRWLFLVVPAMCVLERAADPTPAPAHAAHRLGAGGRVGTGPHRARAWRSLIIGSARRGDSAPGSLLAWALVAGGVLLLVAWAAGRATPARLRRSPCGCSARVPSWPRVLVGIFVNACVRGAGHQPQRLPAVREAGFGARSPPSGCSRSTSSAPPPGSSPDGSSAPAESAAPRHHAERARRGRGLRRPAARAAELGLLGDPARLPAHRLRRERGAHRPGAGHRRRRAGGRLRSGDLLAPDDRPARVLARA